MATGKVEKLYMIMPDMVRVGHRMEVEDFDCDDNGIVGSRDYDDGVDKPIILVCKKSYDIIEEAELVIGQGLLMEDIYVDINLYHLKAGSVIQIGDTEFEVTGPCQAYRYLYAIAPELPELLDGQRGLLLEPVEYGSIAVGNEVKVIKEA